MSSRKRQLAEVDGEGLVWGGIGFAASLVVGVALSPFRSQMGLENVVIVYLAVVAMAAAIGGRAAGLVSSLSAALSYNFFFTTPYYTLRIDSADQVITVVLLFAGGLLASLGGRASRRAGEQAGPFDLDGLPHLDRDGRIPSGHLRSVGGTLVLPAEGTAIDLVRDGRRVGTLVILPAAEAECRALVRQRQDRIEESRIALPRSLSEGRSFDFAKASTPARGSITSRGVGVDRPPALSWNPLLRRGRHHARRRPYRRAGRRAC